MNKDELVEMLEYFKRLRNDSRVAAESFEKRNNEGDAEKASYCRGTERAYTEIVEFLEAEV